MTYGGNFDLRPATPRSMQIFQHDIPGIYAQYITNLEIRNFSLTWGNDLPDFFTHGIECNHINGLLIDGFYGAGNPNSPGALKIQSENTIFRE